MAYPKRNPKQDLAPEERSVVPPVPGIERSMAPPVVRPSGGAPQLNKNSLAYRWQGAAQTSGAAGRLPVPSTMTLPDAANTLKQLSNQVKMSLDARAQGLAQQDLARSRFWRMYQQYPEQAATLVARRLWTDQMVGKGNVADWMRFLEGR